MIVRPGRDAEPGVCRSRTARRAAFAETTCGPGSAASIRPSRAARRPASRRSGPPDGGTVRRPAGPGAPARSARLATSASAAPSSRVTTRRSSAARQSSSSGSKRTFTSPQSGVMSPDATRSRVVLPPPFRPVSRTAVPAARLMSIPSNTEGAFRCHRLETPRSSTAGGAEASATSRRRTLGASGVGTPARPAATFTRIQRGRDARSRGGSGRPVGALVNE
jgi:hypothetical protein